MVVGGGGGIIVARRSSAGAVCTAVVCPCGAGWDVVSISQLELNL